MLSRYIWICISIFACRRQDAFEAHTHTPISISIYLYIYLSIYLYIYIYIYIILYACTIFLQPLCVRRLAQQLLLAALAASPCNVDAAVCTAAVSAATAAGASIWPTQQTHPIFVSRSIGFADSDHFKYPLNGLKMEVFLDIFGLDCNRALRDLFARYIVPYAAAGNLPQLCHCCSCYICAGAKVALAASWSPLGQDAGVANFEIW